MTISDLIDKAVETSAGCIQIADNYPLLNQSLEDLYGIRLYAQNRNIAIEIGGRGLTGENLQKHIELATAFSSPILRMVVDGPEYKPEPDTIVAVIRNALKQLESNNIILALENHDRFHSRVFRQIIEKTGSDYAGICIDCVNSMGIGEGIDSVIDNLAPFAVNFHVKDFSVKRVSHMMGFVVEGTPAGKGFLNLPVVLEKLAHYDKCRSAILELWTPPAGSLSETIEREDAWVKESMVYLKNTIL